MGNDTDSLSRDRAGSSSKDDRGCRTSLCNRSAEYLHKD